jgi:hypothetical protein
LNSDPLHQENGLSIEGADFVMRNRSGPDPERSPNIGSEEHKQMFCRMLLETHNPYKPAVIAWPALAPDAQQRVTSLPIWDIAVQTEGRASIRVKAGTTDLTNPLSLVANWSFLISLSIRAEPHSDRFGDFSRTASSRKVDDQDLAYRSFPEFYPKATERAESRLRI